MVRSKPIFVVLLMMVAVVAAAISAVPTVAALTPHAPIQVDDDADLMAQAAAEGWPGSGTATDPVVISGYHINAGTTALFGITIKRYSVSKHIVVENNRIENVEAGIRASSKTDVRNNVVDQARAIGIECTGGEIEGNTITMSGDAGAGIQTPYDAGTCQIRHNSITGGAWGILALDAGRAMVPIHDNLVAGSSVGIAAYIQADIRRNLVEDCTTGLQVSPYGSQAIITSNVVRRNDVGINVTYSGTFALFDNRIEDNHVGITTDSSRGTIHHNDVSSNGVGIDVSGYAIKVQQNLITGNAIGVGVGMTKKIGVGSATITDNILSNTKNAALGLFAAGAGAAVWSTTPRTGPNILGGPYLGGNFWSDYAGEDLFPDGFGELPYVDVGIVDPFPLVAGATEAKGPVHKMNQNGVLDGLGPKLDRVVAETGYLLDPWSWVRDLRLSGD